MVSATEPKAKLEGEELMRRAKEIYEREIKEKVLPQHKGKLLAIDVWSGDYEVNDDPVIALRALQERHPQNNIFLMRVGYKAAYSMGGKMEEE